MSTPPQGFHYFPNIVTKELSKEILDYFHAHPEEMRPVFGPASRHVRQYGFSYNYSDKKKNVKIDPFPSCIQKLIGLIVDTTPPELQSNSDDSDDSDDYFDQCIANRYMPGEGIGKHIDHPRFGNVIACFTLQSGIEIEFDHPRKGVFKAYVEPRSLYVMRGVARTQWSHQIRPRKNDVVNGIVTPRSIRWSVTFRCAHP